VREDFGVRPTWGDSLLYLHPVRDLQKVCLILSGALVALGLGLGFFRSVYDIQGVKCGTAFVKEPPSAYQFADRPAGPWPSCQSPLSDARVLPILLIGLGMAGSGAAFVIRQSRIDATGAASASM
jgi:hypothetical protein